MKVALPIQENIGLDSHVYSHFGSARYFVIFDTESGLVDVSENPDRDHTHGQCQPINALGDRPVDAVVVGGIGGGALRKLMAAGIKVYRAVEGSVRENVALIKSGRLPEFTLDQACAGHGGHAGCVH